MFREKQITAYGIEPAANVAQIAIDQGLSCVTEFFGVEVATRLAEDGRGADLLICNNVIGHVPDVNDFVAGLRILLNPGGTICIEIPHASNLIKQFQFDTIYQEHYSYWLLTAMRRVLAQHRLELFDVDILSTHGGSLRYYVRHAAGGDPHTADHQQVAAIVDSIEDQELDAGLTDPATYRRYGEDCLNIKFDLLDFLIAAKRDGKTVAAYGAPGKAATLLNFCGIREDLIQYTVDRNPMKQGTFLPGVRIPVLAPETISQTRPDYIVILPWNLKDEISEQLGFARDWGAKFVVPIPELLVF